MSAGIDPAEFARRWIEDWNHRDLERILAHYADDIVFRSPLVAKLGAQADGVLRGKEALGAYWAKALGAAPELRFELLETLRGVAGLALRYKSASGKTAVEVFDFDPQGKVRRSSVYYAA